jgi:hypothetical protein
MGQPALAADAAPVAKKTSSAPAAVKIKRLVLPTRIPSISAKVFRPFIIISNRRHRFKALAETAFFGPGKGQMLK